jgi:hypothetical protein
MNKRCNFVAPMALAWVLVLAACTSSRSTPLAGGDPQACMATCERLAADCRADRRSAPVCKGATSPDQCEHLDGDARRACLSRGLDCALPLQAHCEARRATCVQSCGL